MRMEKTTKYFSRRPFKSLVKRNSTVVTDA
uniref:Structural maintenance of chromosomes protein n=1 Tax=Parascaris univalens TaxID=6257 RepID=A0A915AIE4_PARUN